MSVCPSQIVACFEQAKARNFELSKPELYALVASVLGIQDKDVERAITAS